MDFRDLLKIVRKRWVLGVAIFLLAVALGSAFTFTRHKEYSASAEIFVSTPNSGDAQQLAQGNSFAQARVQSYTEVARSPEVLTTVIKELDLSLSVAQLSDQITATAPVDKVLITITVTDRSPERAMTIGNAVAEAFTTKVERIETPPDTTTSPVNLSVLVPAVTPSGPVSPNVPLNLLISVAVGLVAGFAVVIVREITDNTIKSAEHLAAISGVPVLGSIPLDRQVNSSVIAFRSDAHGARAEAFRQLRTMLQFVDVDSPPRIVAITSALPAEAKTQTAINLAAALAETGQRVCLIEADLRKPTIASVLGLVREVGLTSVLIGESRVEEVMQNAGANLAVLTSGAIPPNPSELLLSEHFRDLLAEISSKVDIIVLDTAPIIPVADGSLVAALADATLLTVRAGKTTKEQVRRAVDALGNVGVHPVGSILSMASRTGSSFEGYYYYGTTPDAAALLKQRSV